MIQVSEKEEQAEEQIAERIKEQAKVGIVMLAAGGSTRMGISKQLLPFRGRTLLRHAALTALESVCDPIVIVLGAFADALRPELDGLDVLVVENADWPDGMSGSLRVGMQAFLSPPPALIVMLCDQPFVTPGLLNKLAQKWQETGAVMIACEYGDSIGVPALFDQSHFPELLALEGAMGAKQVLLRHAPNLERISFAGGIIDVDTPADYARLASSEVIEEST